MTYSEGKAKAIDEAIQWQSGFEEQNYSWYDLSIWGDYFNKLAKRYGLLNEFRENGII